MINAVQTGATFTQSNTLRMAESTGANSFLNYMSSAVEVSKTETSEKRIGVTWIPHDDGVSYGATASYADSSTEDDPVVRVNTCDIYRSGSYACGYSL